MGSSIESASYGGMADFKAIYYGARAVMHHQDPYNPGELQQVYEAEGGKLPSKPNMRALFARAVFPCINLPTSLFLVAPLAMMAWEPAHLLWMALIAGGLILAGFLMWSLARDYAPRLSLLLVCIVLANTVILLSCGNAAGIVIALCIAAVWCFLKNRFVPAGILCLGIALAIKPHDVGFIWLYFVLAGGVRRKWALQSLIVVAALALPAVLWVSPASPHWIQEMHSNLAMGSAHGGLNDPGPSAIGFRGPSAEMVIDLQSVISLFSNDPRIYNPISFLICGVLLLAGAWRTLRLGFSERNAWFALASIAAFSLLPVYHRQYDAKLLLLTVPACALLWAEGGLVGRLGCMMNLAAIVLTADIPATVLGIAYTHLPAHAAGVLDKLLTVLLMRNAVFILLALGIFYLWVYLRRTAPETSEATVVAQDPAGASRERNAEAVPCTAP